ncbi:MAG: 4'-phosphopantetheinyl transferase superfamily protein [Bacteroidetes bacterium]|nr:4'-phosphopantetheinyl transferase superfamily protein [Bacteroidota bacterium]
MPLVQTIKSGNSSIAIWKIEESFEELQNSGNRSAQISDITHPERNRQWLACRKALESLVGDSILTLFKDEAGKPHLESNGYISLSHTAGYAVAIHGPNPVGIDVEEISNRVERIAKRFVSDIEESWIRPENRNEDLFQIWCAKEAIFKLYGRKSVDFKNHIKVTSIPEATSQSFEVQFLKYEPVSFLAHQIKIGNHLIVWIAS